MRPSKTCFNPTWVSNYYQKSVNTLIPVFQEVIGEWVSDNLANIRNTTDSYDQAAAAEHMKEIFAICREDTRTRKESMRVETMLAVQLAIGPNDYRERFILIANSFYQAITDNIRYLTAEILMNALIEDKKTISEDSTKWLDSKMDTPES